MSRALITVVGSVNVDYVSHVRRMPRAGETTIATGYEKSPGGKGLNQALAFIPIASTALVGHVGRDRRGKSIRRIAAASDLNIDYLTPTVESTGRAFITVTSEGESSIVVVPGANSHLDADSVERALEELQPVVVLCQLEIELPTVVACERWAARSGASFVLNCSPLRRQTNGLIARADPIIVNSNEARAIVARSGAVDRFALASELGKIAKSAVVTAGSDGAYISQDAKAGHLPGTRVHAVDTTGAGDAFAGTLAAHLALGSTLIDAPTVGNRAAAYAVQHQRTSR